MLWCPFLFSLYTGFMYFYVQGCFENPLIWYSMDIILIKFLCFRQRIKKQTQVIREPNTKFSLLPRNSSLASYKPKFNVFDNRETSNCLSNRDYWKRIQTGLQESSKSNALIETAKTRKDGSARESHAKRRSSTSTLHLTALTIQVITRKWSSENLLAGSDPKQLQLMLKTCILWSPR